MKVNLKRKRSRRNSRVGERLEELEKLSCLETLDRRERDFLWNSRDEIKMKERYLLPFIKSVDWENEDSRNEAEKLVGNWREPDFFEALHFLGPEFKENEFVRNYGVKLLSKVDDENLIDIILPLVECFLYENQEKVEDSTSSLLSFLIERSSCSFQVFHFFEWSLKSKIEDQMNGKLFQTIQSKFHEKLTQQNPEFMKRLNVQDELVKKLRGLKDKLKTKRKKKGRNRKFMTSFLRKELGNVDWMEFLKSSMGKLVSPISPTTELREFVSETSTIIKSARIPLLLVFRSQDGTDHPLIYYDDTDEYIQDNLMSSMFSLCNRVLKVNGMDLDLITPRITSSSSDAFIDVIKNTTSVCAIEMSKKEYRDISSFLRVKGGAENYESTVDRFIRSCAGYSAITYLFGVGDRHGENIMVSHDGRLFHLDFSFILGHDPKPSPSKVKLTRQMVGVFRSVQGGMERFVKICCDAYLVLRRYSRLFEQVFLLMRENSNMFSFYRDEEDHNKYERTLRYLRSKFRHGETDLEARRCLEMIIEDGLSFKNLKNVDLTMFFQYMRN